MVGRAQRGEILVVTFRSYLTPPAAHQESGTRTEKVEYYDRNGRRLAIAITAAYAAFGVVAQRRDAPERPGDYFIKYVGPDGSLGASGLPNPKWLHDGSRALIPSHRDGQTCPDCLAAATA
ncbi:MAG TPA: hypothetical protein VFC93_03975, partial [Chloroflexota bacterium]|nr:hypothetical protein [Chloroflexota bacterium]